MSKLPSDNSTFHLKAELRRQALASLRKSGAEPVVLEAFGGNGKLFKRVYAGIEQGLVFERDLAKAERLAIQRPSWLVYGSDCVPALFSGVGSDLPVNFLDLDPWGGPWDALEAFVEADRIFPDRLDVVVNDGMKRTVLMRGGWQAGRLKELVAEYGNDLNESYLDVCKILIQKLTASRGYRLAAFKGYYIRKKTVAHYWATLLKK